MNDKGVLYIVATPIGNLGDMTHRALDVLKQADFVAAEDTRHSQKMFQYFGINTKLVAYHDHSSDKQIDQLIDKLESGHSIALISDAGTPLISDPGYRIVKLARQRQIKVTPVPGASAPITAISAAGLATDRFSFEGFLPHKSAARCKTFETIKHSKGTSIFFESPHRIQDSIGDAISVLGEARPAVLARELTKTFETYLGFTLADIKKAQLEDANQRRGELVLMIGAEARDEKSQGDELPDEVLNVLSVLAEELPTKQAAALASKITGQAKKKLYDAALKFKDTN